MNGSTIAWFLCSFIFLTFFGCIIVYWVYCKHYYLHKNYLREFKNRWLRIDPVTEEVKILAYNEIGKNEGWDVEIEGLKGERGFMGRKKNENGEDLFTIKKGMVTKNEYESVSRESNIG